MASARGKELFRVKPAETISDLALPGTTYFGVTLFDTIWLTFYLSQVVFFYRIQNLSPDLFYGTILPRLKHSLSLTLHHFPLLAGILTWHPDTGKPVFLYEHDSDQHGVVLSVVAGPCGLDFESLSTDDTKESQHLRSLSPQLSASDSQANLLSLQLTLFPGHGFSVGLSAQHAAMDGKSAAMFLKAFAAICRDGSLPPELKPHLERSLIQDPSDFASIFTQYQMETTWNKRSFVPRDARPAPGLFRRTFRLTRKQIGQLKDKIGSPVSSFTAVCSHVWTCLVKAEERGIAKENVYLLVNMDCRARLDPPVPSNYFGNCVSFRFAEAKVASLEAGDGIVAAAVAIGEAVRSLVDHGVMKGAEKLLSEADRLVENETVYTFGGSPHFEFYGLDFGWGRPSKVEMVSIENNGSFFLFDDRDANGGIEIGTVMNQPKLQAFASLFALNL